MKNILKYCLFLLIVTFISCKDEVEKPKVSYNKSEKKVAEQKQ